MGQLVSREYRPPKVPRRQLLAGNYYEWNDAPFEFARMCERDYYGIADLRFGLRSVYLVTAPEVIEEMLTTGAKSFRKGLGHKEAQALFGDGLLTADGELWKNHRKVISPFFQSSKMDGYSKRIASSTNAAISQWRDGEQRNIYRDMNVLCLNVIMQSFFGSEVPGAIEIVGQAVNALQTNHSKWTYDSDNFAEAVDRFDAFVDGVIETFRSDRKGASDLVNVLLAEHAANPTTMTRKHVRDQVATMILAGFETTASAITWTLYLLARHPQVATALREELEEILDERSFEELEPMDSPLLASILSESLRLFPPAHRLSRHSLVPVELGGYSFPAGTDFIIPVWAVHRSARHYDQPDAFRPERWTREMRSKLPRFAFLPFGGGARQCIGQSMAYREMTIIVSSIIHRFDLKPAFLGDKAPYNGITLLPEGSDLQLRVRQIRHIRRSRPIIHTA